MANAKKCDRCGAFYEVRGFMTLEKTVITKVRRLFKNGVDDKLGEILQGFDLCDCCFDSLQDWLEGGKREKA